MYKVVDHSSSQVAIKKHFVIVARDKDLVNSIRALVAVSITVVAIAVTRI